MARAKKAQDQSNYESRLRRGHTGDYRGGHEMTETSRYLAIKFDYDKGIPISEEKKKYMEAYENNELRGKL